ncbi:MAG: radical SAM protein [Aerococcaceae bacterium]|nr:radical SAM protein [Aerococcaceae bacterium]
MYYNLNPNAYYHYFGNQLLVMIGNKTYLLNESQTLIFEYITSPKYIESLFESVLISKNSTNNIRILIDTFIKKNLLIKECNQRKLHIFGQKGAFFPKKIIIELTDKCHLSCEHCFKKCSPLKSNRINHIDLLKFLEKMKGKVNEIQLTGGEPLLHPYFSLISDFINENFDFTTITTTAAFVNDKNIETLANFDYIQISLYDSVEQNHNSITKHNNSFSLTINGIQRLKEKNIYIGISNIVRNSIIENLHNYLDFLVSLKVDEVGFGILSRLGRAEDIGLDWIVSKNDIIKFENILPSIAELYKGKLIVKTWEEKCGTAFFQSISDTFLGCGAGLLEWNINESGIIKPCSFFSDKHFSDINIYNFEIFFYENQAYSINQKIKDWECELNSVGLSTKHICETIYKTIRRPYE